MSFQSSLLNQQTNYQPLVKGKEYVSPYLRSFEKPKIKRNPWKFTFKQANENSALTAEVYQTRIEKAVLLVARQRP